MTDPILIALATAVLNGAVTWGILTTKLAWMRADLDAMSLRMRDLEHSAGFTRHADTRR